MSWKRGDTLVVDGSKRVVVDALSSGPGAPVHTFVLRSVSEHERAWLTNEPPSGWMLQEPGTYPRPVSVVWPAGRNPAPLRDSQKIDAKAYYAGTALAPKRIALRKSALAWMDAQKRPWPKMPTWLSAILLDAENHDQRMFEMRHALRNGDHPELAALEVTQQLQRATKGQITGYEQLRSTKVKENPSPSDNRAAELYATLVANREAWSAGKYGWDRFELIQRRTWETIEHEPVKVKEHVWMLVHAGNRAREMNAAELASWKKNPVDLTHFDQTQVKRGIAEETKEHGKALAPRVVADHLALDPNYYAPKGKRKKSVAIVTHEKVTVEKTTAVMAKEAKRNPTTGKPITGKAHMTRKQAERGFTGSTNREWNAYLDKLRSDGRIWQSERDEWVIPKNPGDSAPGNRATAQRIVNAEERFIAFAEDKGFSRDEALEILRVYRKHKAIKIDPIGGGFTFTHGNFANKPVMKRALAEARSEKNPAPATGIQEWGYVWQLDCIDPKGKPFTVKLGNMQWMMGHDPDGKAWPANEALIVRYTLTDEREIDPKDVPRSMRKYAGSGPIYGGQFHAPSGADWKLAGVCHHIWYERVGTKHPGHWQHPYGEHGEELPNLYTWTYKGQKFYRLCLGDGAVWNVRGFVTP